MHGGHLSARLGQVTKLTEPRLQEERVKHVEVVQSKHWCLFSYRRAAWSVNTTGQLGSACGSKQTTA